MKTATDNISLRTIRQDDNPVIANIIRSTLKEFGANHPGTVYYDATTDHLFELFSSTPRSVYYVAEIDGSIVGGGGIFPSPGLPGDTCELVKMYLLPQARGLGLGSKLITQCIEFAKQNDYRNIYLETMPELKQALKTYEKFGFNYINAPMGNTGHFACDVFYLQKL